MRAVLIIRLYFPELELRINIHQTSKIAFASLEALELKTDEIETKCVPRTIHNPTLPCSNKEVLRINGIRREIEIEVGQVPRKR